MFQGSVDNLSAAARVSHVFFTFLLCLAITIVPVATHFVSPGLAIAFQFVLVSGCVLYLTPLVPLVVVFALVFQNLFVSLFSGYLVDGNDYNFVRGYNFLTMMISWLWLFGHYTVHWRDKPAELNRIMLVCLGGFVLIGLYLLVGMAKNPTGAIIYLRNVITPLILFQIFLLTSQRLFQPILPFFVALTALIILLGYVEMSDRVFWLDITNGWRIWELGFKDEIDNLVWDKLARETGHVNLGILDTMAVDFLNTPLLGDYGFTILRMSGPNIHAISYSYLLSFLAILMLMSGRWIFALLIVPLLLLASAKGALIMIFLALAALLARRLFGAVFAYGALLLVLIAYIGIGIFVGLRIGDYHVLGFMGGVHDFLGNPFGRGLGDGGNLVANFGALDWPAYQAAGRTPVAMESAVGVLLHQMGVATFGLLALYFWISVRTYKISLVSRLPLHSIASFILAIVVVNGIFQEEAIFSPLALGLIMALNGHVIGGSLRRMP